MYIKSIRISGFKSYRDVLIDGLSPGHNLIVGRNGSGKSNFFEAIRFVLSDQHGNIRAEERQDLLHEGAGTRLMSAFVEIVFDNHEGRIPQDTDEVVLRRTIGVKKDEYFVNRKHVTKSDVVNMFESAGFSKANPYYIVEQGKVQKLVNMSDGERLQLLKEVAGTEVYETRREESLKILSDTDANRERIEEVIAYIEDRLKELSNERNELAQFQTLDKDRKALEYTLYDKELASAKERLEAIEIARDEEQKTSSDLQTRLLELRGRIITTQTDIDSNRSKTLALTEERTDIEERLPELSQQRTNAQVRLSELDSQHSDTLEQQINVQQELAKVQARAQEVKAELETVLIPQWQSAETEYLDVAQRLQSREAQLQNIYDKTGRSQQFSSPEERDEFIGHEIANLRADKSAKSETIQQIEKELIRLKKQLADCDAKQQKLRTEVDIAQQKILEASSQEKSVSSRLTACVEERVRAWQHHGTIEKKFRSVSESQRAAEAAFQRQMPSAIRRGVAELSRMREEKISGIHGPLIDLIKLDHEKFQTAVEVVARNQLWNVVVDDEAVAAKCIERLNQKKAGRITLMPLNRMQVKDVLYPSKKEDCIPLVSKMHFEAKFAPAIHSIFSRVLLCRDIDVASQYAAKEDMTCVTLDGDVVQRRGAMFGGFHDPTGSRFAAYNKHINTEKDLKRLKNELKEAQQEGTRCDQLAASLRGEQTNCGVNKARAKLKMRELNSALDKVSAQSSSIQQDITSQENRVAQLQRELRNLSDSMTTLQSELGTPLHQRLSSSDEAEIEQLRNDIQELKANAEEKDAYLQSVRQKKVSAESNLEQNLMRRIKELKTHLAVEAGGTASDSIVAQGDIEEEIRDCKAKALEAEREEKLMSARLADTNATIQELGEQYTTLNEVLSSLQSEESSLATELDEEARKSEKLLEKRTLAQSKKDDAMAKIRDLGSLPGKELDKYQEWNKKRILTELKQVNDKLKSYAHVNRKALDQFSNFAEQRETLLQRKAELDRAAEKIHGLIQHLDMKKDEAIMRTFKGVSKHFREVFNELVPRGSASIKIRRTEMSHESDMQQDVRRRIESFCGVAVEASFDATEETCFLQQLSGGQKALVALALIFAIQRCDPAPFYLFDEVDQALDATHRASVAKLIKKQAHADEDENPAQFITSTFRPELASVADSFYGVLHQHKVSSVVRQTKDEALGFILQIMHEEEVAQRDQAKTDEINQSMSNMTLPEHDDNEKRQKVER